MAGHSIERPAMVHAIYTECGQQKLPAFIGILEKGIGVFPHLPSNGPLARADCCGG